MTTNVVSDTRGYATDPDFQAELLALEVTNQITLAMEKQRLSQSDMAARLAVSPAYLSRVLSGNPNMTLKTIAKFAIALGLVVTSFKFEELASVASSRSAYKNRDTQETPVETQNDQESPEDTFYRDFALAA